MALGGAVKLGLSAGFLIPSTVAVAVPLLPKAEIAFELAPALLGVGYILGYRQSGVLVAGSIVSALALTPLIAIVGMHLGTPLAPEPAKLVSAMTSTEIWSHYVRYIGAGAVATAGILTVVAGMPTMWGALLGVLKGVAGSRPGGADAEVARTDRDMPPIVIVAGVVFVILIAALVPGIFGGALTPSQRAICAAGVGFFGLLFVAVAARIVGIVGVSSQPTSGITLVTLLGVATVFAYQGWTGPGAMAAVLTVGTVVAIAASKAGDISQDLKTGWLVGATPARQQLGQVHRCGGGVLGGGGCDPSPGQDLHVRFARNTRTAGDPDEDHHRGCAGRLAALGAGRHRRRCRHLGDALRRERSGLCDRRLPAVVIHADDLRRRARTAPSGASAHGSGR